VANNKEKREEKKRRKGGESSKVFENQILGGLNKSTNKRKCMYYIVLPDFYVAFFVVLVFIMFYDKLNLKEDKI
jgi:hypothetical protein